IIIESLSGSLTLDGNGSGTIVTTGTGTINRPGSGGNIGPGILISALGANAVNMNANYTFNAGPTGFSTIGMRDASTGLTDTNLLGFVNVGAGVPLTATGVGPNIPPRNQFYGTINLVGPNIPFGANSSIVSVSNAITDIRFGANHFAIRPVFDPNPSPLTV